MNSSLDALDMYFNEIVNDQCSSANTILSHLLGRQSLTEVDHNRGLKDALQLAKECKVHSQHTS